MEYEHLKPRQLVGKFFVENDLAKQHQYCACAKVTVMTQSRTIPDHLQRLFVLFCFQGSPNEWELLANGRGGGRFPDHLPLGQQYLPLNRKHTEEATRFVLYLSGMVLQRGFR